MFKRLVLSMMVMAALFILPIGAQAMVVKSESNLLKSSEIMHLTPEKNPADSKQVEEINEDVKSGNVINAKLKSSTDQVQINGIDFSTVYPFTFQGVSYAGLQSQNFSITENDVSIEARAWQSNGDPGSGYYTITLYRDGWIDKNLGTTNYRYTPQKHTYYNIWFGVGAGNYYFIIRSPETLIDGDGRVLQRL